MRHFTLFTLLYLAAGVCQTVIALQPPDITRNLKTILLVNAGLSYLTAVLSTFPLWRQGVRRSQANLHDRPARRRNFFMLLPLLVIALTLFRVIPDLVNHNWAKEAITRASSGLLLILISAEQLFITSQIRQ